MRYLHAESLSVRSPLETIMGGLQPGRKPGSGSTSQQRNVAFIFCALNQKLTLSPSSPSSCRATALMEVAAPLL